jgi:hypothetical protein
MSLGLNQDGVTASAFASAEPSRRNESMIAAASSGAGQQKQMAAIDFDELGVGQQGGEDPSVDRGHEGVVPAGHDQNRLADAVQPVSGQTETLLADNGYLSTANVAAC